MSHTLTDAQMAGYMQNMKTAKEALETTTKQLNEAKEKLVTFTNVLNEATNDIKLLLAFIKSKGLQPPTIQSKFIN